MSRFVILARRLEAQMEEMESGGLNASPSTDSRQVGAGEDNEDEKERTIAKAALSIAEIGTSYN
jgi:conserved oligomeric Golgi complex subunit 5